MYALQENSVILAQNHDHLAPHLHFQLISNYVLHLITLCDWNFGGENDISGIKWSII